MNNYIILLFLTNAYSEHIYMSSIQYKTYNRNNLPYITCNYNQTFNINPYHYMLNNSSPLISTSNIVSEYYDSLNPLFCQIRNNDRLRPYPFSEFPTRSFINISNNIFDVLLFSPLDRILASFIFDTMTNQINFTNDKISVILYCDCNKKLNINNWIASNPTTSSTTTGPTTSFTTIDPITTLTTTGTTTTFTTITPTTSTGPTTSSTTTTICITTTTTPEPTTITTSDQTTATINNSLSIINSFNDTIIIDEPTDNEHPFSYIIGKTSKENLAIISISLIILSSLFCTTTLVLSIYVYHLRSGNTKIYMVHDKL